MYRIVNEDGKIFGEFASYEEANYVANDIMTTWYMEFQEASEILYVEEF